uniref:J domain-containing protein n=2 Tax=Parascaris univalens TaxID=6257 RepID=A0A915CJH4_PARUN
MSSTFANDAKRLFGTNNLYEILQLPSRRTPRNKLPQDEIKKAFFKQSLRFHPDRCVEESSKKEATEKFQILSRAYSILGDEEKRKVYDETGIMDDAEFCDDDVNWEERWRAMFKKVTKEDIQSFVEQYKESGEERKAIKESYVKNKGDVGKIMMDVIGLTYEDEDRVRAIIDEMIEKGELKASKRYVAEPAARREKRRKAGEKEAKEAEEALREIAAKENTGDLRAMIMKRQLDRESFFDELAAKYAKPTAAKRKKKAGK